VRCPGGANLKKLGPKDRKKTPIGKAKPNQKNKKRQKFSPNRAFFGCFPLPPSWEIVLLTIDQYFFPNLRLEVNSLSLAHRFWGLRAFLPQFFQAQKIKKGGDGKYWSKPFVFLYPHLPPNPFKIKTRKSVGPRGLNSGDNGPLWQFEGGKKGPGKTKPSVKLLRNAFFFAVYNGKINLFLLIFSFSGGHLGAVTEGRGHVGQQRAPAV